MRTFSERHFKNRDSCSRPWSSLPWRRSRPCPRLPRQPPRSPCPGGGPLVVNAYSTFRQRRRFRGGRSCLGARRGRESMQIWQIGTNTYCVKRQFIGTFTTFAV